VGHFVTGPLVIDRFVIWVFSKLGLFVMGHYVMGHFVKGRFVMGRHVSESVFCLYGKSQTKFTAARGAGGHGFGF
jgi:hypothetical protein